MSHICQYFSRRPIIFANMVTCGLSSIAFVAVFIASANAFQKFPTSCGVKLSTGTKVSTAALSAGFGKLPEKISVAVVDKSEGKCLCGSDINYVSCCKPFHDGGVNDPSTLIRSRYSAYAAGNIDYIISSTSKESSDYKAFIDTPIAPANGLKRWAKSIKSNMLEQYQYVRMEIDSVKIDEKETEATVVWRHLAIRRGDNVMFPIEEESTVAKLDNVWTYIKGAVARPDPETSQTMMTDWPTMVGLELKFDEEKAAAATGPKPTKGKRQMMDFEGSKKFKPKMTQNTNSQTKNSERSGSP